MVANPVYAEASAYTGLATIVKPFLGGLSPPLPCWWLYQPISAVFIAYWPFVALAFF
jgi:hypothetical protein